MQVGASSFLDLTVKYTICNENCTVFITNRRCGYRQSIGIGGGCMGAERGKNAQTQMRHGNHSFILDLSVSKNAVLRRWIEDLELLRSRAICRSLRSSRKESGRML